MEELDTLLAATGRHDTEPLLGVDAELLAEYVIDTGNPWFHRRRCVAGLAGRVPPTRVPGLLDRVRDPAETGEVRQALLGLLADRAELLPWLLHPDRDAERYSTLDAVLTARGVAGDLTVLPRLTELANDDWPRRRDLAGTGLAALARRHGLEPVLAALDPERPADRAASVRLRHADGRDVTDGLADPDATVAHLAASLSDDTDRLRGYLSEASTLEAGLWAVWALHESTGDVDRTREYYLSLGAPRVEVPGLDEEVRAAVIREWVPHCQRRSDPRWRLEAVCVDRPEPPDPFARLDRAVAALAGAGLAPGEPSWSGDIAPGGYGTYHAIDYEGGSVLVSALGRFAVHTDSTTEAAGATATAALAAADFRWIDDELARVTVTGLHTYLFGDRGVRDVRTLLFHWTD